MQDNLDKISPEEAPLSDDDLDNFDDIDTKEIDVPETIYIRDIETRVFQSITIKCLSSIEGIALLEGTLMDNLLGREGLERIKGNPLTM